jgi:predicted nucleic acid-binding protein
MIVLDTDVLSAAMLPRPDPAVVLWLDRQARISVWTTAITVLEVRFGIALLPSGSRKSRLERAFERLLGEHIEDRVLPFDAAAAGETAILMAGRRRTGRTGDLRDAMIAGIAIARKATVATGNTRHFTDLPVPVVDPWSASPART